MTAVQLRRPQIEAHKHIKAAYLNGHTRQIFSLPTGVGKTTVFVLLKQLLGLSGTALILVHSEDLLRQAYERWKSFFPTDVLGIEQSDRKTSRLTKYDAIFAMRQTLTGGRLEQFVKDHFIELVIVDEAHLAQSNQYIEILTSVGCLPLDNPNNPILIGCTATPWRLDNKSLQDIFPYHAYDYPILDAMREGYWCPIKAWRLKTQVDLTGLNSTKGDFQVGDLENKVKTHERTDLIVQKWLELDGMNKRTLIFGVGKEHAALIAEAFKKHTENAWCVVGETPNREQIYDKFMNLPRPTVLSNVEVATTGVDFPNVDFIINARPTKSSGLFIQMLGRGTRLFDGNPVKGLIYNQDTPKDFLQVLDVVDSMRNHKDIMTTPRVLGLPPNFDLNGESLQGARDLLDQLFDEDPALAAAAPKLMSSKDDDDDDNKLPSNLAELKAELERISILAPENPRGATKGISRLEWLIDDHEALISGDLQNAKSYSLLIPRPINAHPSVSEVLLRISKGVGDEKWVLDKYSYPPEKCSLESKIQSIRDELKSGYDKITGNPLTESDLGKRRGMLKNMRKKSEEFEFEHVGHSTVEPTLKETLEKIDALVYERYPKSLALIDETSEWRRRPPSEKQLQMAKKLKIPVKPQMRMGDLSRALDKALRLQEESKLA